MKERGKEWYRMKGTMKLLKNDIEIRSYRFIHVADRRRILEIWKSEVKPNGIDKLELIIKLD